MSGVKKANWFAPGHGGVDPEFDEGTIELAQALCQSGSFQTVPMMLASNDDWESFSSHLKHPWEIREEKEAHARYLAEARKAALERETKRKAEEVRHEVIRRASNLYAGNYQGRPGKISRLPFPPPKQGSHLMVYDIEKLIADVQRECEAHGKKEQFERYQSPDGTRFLSEVWVVDCVIPLIMRAMADDEVMDKMANNVAARLDMKRWGISRKEDE